MPRYSPGDLVSYQPADHLSSSLGIITQVADEDLIRVYWYVEHIIPNPRGNYDWLPASILEHAGGLRILSSYGGKDKNV